MPASTGLTEQINGKPLSAFGRTLARIRETRNLSQFLLAERLGRSTSFISLLENGKRNPTRELLSELSKVLILSPEESNQLLGVAGFPADELNRAIQNLLEVIAKQVTINTASKALLEQDLRSMANSWLEAFQETKKLRAGYFAEDSLSFDKMVTHTEYSPTLICYLKLCQADYALQAGELISAQRNIQEALRLLEGWPEEWAPTLRAEIIAIRGMLALRSGLYQSARAFINESMSRYLKLFSAAGEYGDLAKQGLARSYKRLAQLALLEGEPDQALIYCANAESYFQQIKKDATLAGQWLRRIKELKAWAHAQMDEFDEAICLHTEALEESKRADDTYGVLKNTVYLADDYRRRLDVRIGRAGGFEIFDVDERRAKVQELLEGEPTEWLLKTESFYKEALQGSRDMNERILRGRCLRGLGIILRLKATYENEPTSYIEAQQSLDQALLLERELGMGRRLPGIYESLAKLAWDWGHPQSAKRYYEAALREMDSPLVSSDDPASERLRRRIKRALKILEANTADNELIETVDPEDLRQKRQGALSRWHSTCQDLVRVINGVIVEDEAKGLRGLAEEEKWLREMLWMEEESGLSGPRILAQNRLSASLALNLPKAGFPSEGAIFHRQRYYAFIQQVKLAGAPGNEGPYQDLCCRDTIERGLKSEETQSLFYDQATKALELVKYPGYQLYSSMHELPLAFAVRGNRTLVEIPGKLVPSSALKTVGVITPDSAICYRFDNKNLAEQLKEIFNRLITVAEEESFVRKGTTQEWLQSLVAGLTTSERPLSGMPL